jgi:branched-chain amino acid transport system ATP-binding protein
LYLEITNLTVLYDRATVLNKVSLKVDRRETVSLVGPNGAGKTTLLRAIAGLVRWEKETLKGTILGKITIEGSVLLEGEEIIELPAHEVARRKLILCPERGRPFREMTVKDNLLIGAYQLKDNGAIRESLARVYELFPPLEKRKEQVAGTLSGGERTMLSIGRSLMSQVELLLIDEPSVGLAPIIKEHLFERIKAIQTLGITILLVEQDIGFAFNIALRNYAMSRGKIIAEGSGQNLLSDELIRKTYLGSEI